MCWRICWSESPDLHIARKGHWQLEIMTQFDCSPEARNTIRHFKALDCIKQSNGTGRNVMFDQTLNRQGRGYGTGAFWIFGLKHFREQIHCITCNSKVEYF